MVIIGIVAILLFGKRLPDVGRSLGKGIMEFKKGVSGVQDEIERASSRPSRSYVADEREEASAPRFEPPPAEEPAEQQATAS
jgi:sec-independent protein translocase protein TatA